jgi:hypothetical protein
VHVLGNHIHVYIYSVSYIPTTLKEISKVEQIYVQHVERN